MASVCLVLFSPIFVRASASPPRAASRKGALSAANALTMESALVATASETLSESLRTDMTGEAPRPPPPCACAAVPTTTNIAAAITAV